MNTTPMAQGTDTLCIQQTSTAPCANRLILIAIGNVSRHLDVASLLDVFNEANRLTKIPLYQVRVVTTVQDCSLDTPPFSSFKVRINYQDVIQTADTLIVVDSDDVDRTSITRDYRHWLHQQCSRSRRVVAVGGGILILAAAGVLDGQKVVAHWALQDHLRRYFPRVRLEPDLLYTVDKNLYTCAGAVASIDLALRLVEEDLNRDTAWNIARRLLLHFRRTAQSSQVSLTLRAQLSTSDPIASLLCWLPENLTKDLSVCTLAKRVAMSPRNFARVFRQQMGTTPAKYVECLRFEAARRELGSATQTIARAAELTGFASTETLRRTFMRRLGVTPVVFRGQHR